MSILKKIADALRGRPFKMYSVYSFYDTYKNGLVGIKLGDEIMDRLCDANFEGRICFKVYDDEMEQILANKAKQEEFNRKIARAAELNNEGIALEKAGDIAGAIAKYEENILPDARLSLHPYHRLCVLYRRAGDYDNEIRVIETCLARPEWKTKQYTTDPKEHNFFLDRLTKAKAYKYKSRQ